jgi:hypothetical protein
MLGFELDLWDYITFAIAFLAGGAGVLTYIWIAGLPGRIALARNHPEAEAVKLMGWAGLLPTVLPWIQALIWAFKPTDIVDVRRFPREEARVINEEMARLKGAPSHTTTHSAAPTTAAVVTETEAASPTPPLPPPPAGTAPRAE